MKFKFLTSMLLVVTMMFSSLGVLASSDYAYLDLSTVEITELEEEASEDVDTYLPEGYYQTSTSEVSVLENEDLDEFVAEYYQDQDELQEEEYLFDEAYLFDEFSLIDPGFIEIEPFAVLPSGQISLSPDVIFALDYVYVTLTYMATTASPRTFTITLPYGGEFLVTSPADVTFVAGLNGATQNATEVKVTYDTKPTMNEYTLTLTTPNNAAFQQNTIRFRVQAPLMSSYLRFNVDVDLGYFFPPGGQYIRFPMRSYLTIEAPNVVDDVTPFVISGYALVRGEDDTPVYAPPGSFVLLEIVRVHEDATADQFPSFIATITGERYHQDVILVNDNGYESGEFLIRAYLMSADGLRIYAFAERPITVLKRPDIVRIALQRDNGGIDSRVDPEEWRMDPTHPATDEERLFLRSVVVDLGPGFWVRGGSPVTASVQMKLESAAQNVTDAEFVLQTTHGTHRLDATLDGSTFSARFAGFQSNIFLSPGRRPYVEFTYTLDGETRTIRLGYLQIIVDPEGTIHDAETGEAIVGATVTLLRLDGEVIDGVAHGFWEVWVSHNDQLNPQITGSDGRFQWDVEDGWYDIRVEHPDYGFFLLSMHSDYGYLEVPPERLGLRLYLHRIATQEGHIMELFYTDLNEFLESIEE
ncbi:MAG: carboxypeptidase-like regulatory domain-containing protein [Defluviitaleaceae bacterium]|nr:carboxypeptidase-like regulatory domain-containing protein [Defluviitaleaceae bacterium]